MKVVTVFWFRRDLRLEDNCGLFNALTSSEDVLPIFIFDKQILSKLSKDDARVCFIHQQLQKINVQLIKAGSSLSIYHNKPLDVFKKLITEYEIKKVVTNHDYEPYATKRDDKIMHFLNDNNIIFETHKDQVIFEKDDIVKDDGTPYKVYTPYSKKWLAKFNATPFKQYKSEKHINTFLKTEQKELISLAELGFNNTTTSVSNFILKESLIDNYEATRNYPAVNGTSKIGPHIRFGTISIREIVKNASRSSSITFFKELIWREFFMQILWHFPHTVTQSFKPQYERIPWRNNEVEFDAWCKGRTGYPLVDAGMRELNQTGFMHNRVRMLVGSFLCKHLLIDWRWGEAYFASKLHDFELSSNVGNWQWVAGCGVDAAPYFRIFNPTTQIQKFDKSLEYITKWVPDFQELTYPQPMVDHKFARERCLKTYKEALANE